MTERIDNQHDIETQTDSTIIRVEVADTCRVKLTLVKDGVVLHSVYMDSNQAELLRYAITDAYESVDYWNS